jgi:DNA-binding MarR family transcriptional regulator
MSKQSGSPLRLDEFLPYRLSISANAVSRVIASAYDVRFGLTIPEWRLIAVLREAQSATQQDLVRRTLMDKVAVSRAAAGLVERGLVKRTTDTKDARARRLSLTQDGMALHAEIAPLALGFEQNLLAHFNASEIAVLKDLLSRLEKAAIDLEAPDPDRTNLAG